MIYAIVGIPGAGKSFLAVKTMLDYIASGGVCFSNIKLSGLEDSGEDGFFRWKFKPDSPVLSYLSKVLKWDYQDGQYSYIDLDKYDESFLSHVPSGTPEKRILLILDEVNEWFDSNDRGKVQRDSKYNELFKFLRLSRHYHIDVCFVLQDFQTLNSRLRGLCAQVIQSRDLQATKIAGIPIPFPFKWFLWQYFNPKNGTPIKSVTWYKDPLVFACYDSFVGFSGVPLAGQVQSSFSSSQSKKKVKKMSKIERVFLYGIICLLGFFVFRRASPSGVPSDKNPVSSNQVSSVSSFFNPESVRAASTVESVPVGAVERVIYCDYFCFDMMGYRAFYLGNRKLQVGDVLPWGEVLNLFDSHCEVLGRGGETIFLLPRG